MWAGSGGSSCKQCSDLDHHVTRSNLQNVRTGHGVGARGLHSFLGAADSIEGVAWKGQILVRVFLSLVGVSGDQEDGCVTALRAQRQGRPAHSSGKESQSHIRE